MSREKNKISQEGKKADKKCQKGNQKQMRKK